MLQEPPPPAWATIDEQAVALMSQTLGLWFPAERLGDIAQRLREMHELAADLDAVDLTGAEPSGRFDATWPEDGAR